eukprot:GILK01008541.1.p1 GENE.GILK01008541.1~~GILK01008541.1.p1  ORF type:complete len:1250 (-),score=240.95 GILK01008541.1:92-3841(-)
MRNTTLKSIFNHTDETLAAGTIWNGLFIRVMKADDAYWANKELSLIRFIHRFRRQQQFRPKRDEKFDLGAEQERRKSQSHSFFRRFSNPFNKGSSAPTDLTLPMINICRIRGKTLLVVPVLPVPVHEISSSSYPPAIQSILEALDVSTVVKQTAVVHSDKNAYFFVNPVQLFPLHESSKRFVLTLPADSAESCRLSVLPDDQSESKKALKMLCGENKSDLTIAEDSLIGDWMGTKLNIFYRHVSKERPNVRAQFLSGSSDNISGPAVAVVQITRPLFVRPELLPISKSKGMSISESIHESLLACIESLNQVESDPIVHSNHLCQVMHTHGLNMGLSWIILRRLNNDRLKELFAADLVARAIKRLVRDRNPEMSLENARQDYQSEICDYFSALFVTASDSDNDFINWRRMILETSLLISFLRVFHFQPFCNGSSDVEWLEPVATVMHLAVKSPLYLLHAIQHHLKISFSMNLVREISTCRSNITHLLFPNNVSDVLDEIEPVVSSPFLYSYYKDACIALSPLAVGARQSAYASSSNISVTEDVDGFIHELNQSPVVSQINSSAGSLAGPLSPMQNKMLNEYKIFVSMCKSLFSGVMTVGNEMHFLPEAYLELALALTITGQHDKSYEMYAQANALISHLEQCPAELLAATFSYRAYTLDRMGEIEMAETDYLAAVATLQDVWGDPRKRGFRGHPWCLFMAWKLATIGKAKKELSQAVTFEEQFEALRLSYPSCPLTMPGSNWDQPEVEYISEVERSAVYFMDWLQKVKILDFKTGLVMPREAEAGAPPRPWEALGVGTGLNLSLLEGEVPPGSVLSWGDSSQNQLGLGRVNRLVNHPRRLIALKDFTIAHLACGGNFSLCVDIHGNMFAWGENEFGQLGLGVTSDESVERPQRVPLPSGVAFVQMSCGMQHSVAIDTSGSLWSWGNPEAGVLGRPEDTPSNSPYRIHQLKDNRTATFRMVSCGSYHSVALTDDGKLYSWGRADGSQLGLMHPETFEVKETPEKMDVFVSKPTRLAGPLDDVFVISVACGEVHNLALADTGRVYSWGWGEYGQLGQGLTADQFAHEGTGGINTKVLLPTMIDSLKPHNIVKVVCGSLFCAVLTDRHEVFTWGINDMGQLGHEDVEHELATPRQLECFQGIPVVMIACGWSHSVAVLENGLMFSWGDGRYGQLGRANTLSTKSPRVVQAITGTRTSLVACGHNHTLAITASDADAEAPESPPCASSWKLDVGPRDEKFIPRGYALESLAAVL